MQSSVIDAYAGNTGNALALRVSCALILILGAPDDLEQHGLLLEEQ